VTLHYDKAWVTAVARSRGLEIGDTEAEKLARFVAPILERLAEMSGELTADEDMYEFRRLLIREATGG
jgi:hypothetical protein